MARKGSGTEAMTVSRLFMENPHDIENRAAEGMPGLP
jgi:hypothetical protein